MLEPQDVRQILEVHDRYFDAIKDDMRLWKRLYMTKFWDPSSQRAIDGVLRTQLPKAYKVVESYIGSLYSKDPSVRVEADLRDRGNPEVAAAVANQYLGSVREQLEDATRLALIYPCSFLKLAPIENIDPLKRVACAALPPWEVIVDATAASWDQQRYVGHVYLMPMPEAEARFAKGESQDFRSRVYSKWIDAATTGNGGLIREDEQTVTPDSEKWIRVVELYDLLADKLLVWSPDYRSGDEFLFQGVTVQVGALPDQTQDGKEPEAELVHETTGIPFKSASGRPVVPIIPLYFSRDPDTPLRGYSLVSRSADQFREINVMRTYQAQGVRRMARQWLVRAGFLSEEAESKVAQGVDGEFIEVDLAPGMPIEGNMSPVPQAPIPGDVIEYAATVDADINDAGVLAPFTRGEATGTTATEQQLLASYTSSEIGRMARIRDAAITAIAYTYNIILSVVLGEDAEPLALPNPIGPTILSAEDLTGDFKYWAVDAGTTPMSDFTKQQSLERLAPVLVQLGADPKVILEEMVRVFQLPQQLSKPLPPPPAPAGPGPATMVPPGEVAPGASPMPTPEEVL
jgi:hypothetical protein